jgi:Large polyvalent protein-associated domain 7/Relaxase/Mobilisation nuclease domain
MNKISRGAAFFGVVSYCLRGKKNEDGHGRNLGGTMAGITVNDIAAEFRAISATRPDIKKPVWHSSLRMPRHEDVSDEKWCAIADDYLELMGIDKANAQVLVVKHEPEHIHLILNRVFLDGTVFLGQNENLKNTTVIKQLEHLHGLTVTKGVDADATGKIMMPAQRGLKKAELDKADRIGIRPPRLMLQEIVMAATAGRPTTAEFMERLEFAGVVVRPNVANTGKMNGFSFEIDGIPFSGSQLGKKYGWSELQKRLDYEQARDCAELARRRDAARGSAENDANAGKSQQSAETNGRIRRQDSAARGDVGDTPAIAEIVRPTPSSAGIDCAARSRQEADADCNSVYLETNREEIRRDFARAAESIREIARPEQERQREGVNQKLSSKPTRKLMPAPVQIIHVVEIGRAKKPRAFDPDRSNWIGYRLQLQERYYGSTSQELAKFWRIGRRSPSREIIFENATGRLIDKGPIVTAAHGNDHEIKAMLELAKIKNWPGIQFGGESDFKFRAMTAALRNKMVVLATTQADLALLAKARAIVDEETLSRIDDFGRIREKSMRRRAQEETLWPSPTSDVHADHMREEGALNQKTNLRKSAPK